MTKCIAGVLTVMNKIACMLLTICLLASSALADTRPPMRLMDVSSSAYWKQHPEINQKAMIYDWHIDPLTHLQSDNAPDLLLLRTYNDDFAAIRDAGVLADLSQSEAIRDAVSRMRPDAQALVTTEDGRILGLPILQMVLPFYWYQDAWDEAGLTADDVPQSYVDLLDFLDAWAERVAEQPEKNVCVTRTFLWSGGKEEYHYSKWLISTLTIDWVMQKQYAGEAVCFHTPEFIALAERTRNIGQKLYAAEPSEKKRQKMLQLFENDMEGGEHANNGRDDGLSHTIPYRVTNDQPVLMKADMDICCVRADSLWLQEALDFMTYYKDEQPFFFRYALYTDFKPGEYAYEDGGGSAIISKGWLEDFSAYDGTLVYTHCTLLSNMAYGELLNAFFSGEISADELAVQMDEIQFLY